MVDFYEPLKNEIGEIKIVDIGAMAIGEETNVYEPILAYDGSSVLGFEPVEEECEKLNSHADAKHRYLPHFIGDGSDRTFHLCNSSMTSSLFNPNIPLMDNYQNLAELCSVTKTCSVTTRRLDDIKEVEGADFIKIDVQGAELDVFKGAVELLSGVMVIHTEVEFLQLYIDQPLFADIDSYLRNEGFQFHKFNSVSGRTLKPLIVNNDINFPMSQQLWADAVYIKNIMKFDSCSLRSVLKFALIMHESYRAYDFCHYALSYYDLRTGNHYAGQYLQSLIEGTRRIPSK